MSTISQRAARVSGISLVAIGAAGLLFWFVYLRDAVGQTPAGGISGNCNVIGSNNISCSTINLGPPPPTAQVSELSVSDVPGGFEHKIAFHINSATAPGFVKITADPTHVEGMTLVITGGNQIWEIRQKGPDTLMLNGHGERDFTLSILSDSREQPKLSIAFD